MKSPMATATLVPHQKVLVFTWGLSLMGCWNHLVGKSAQLGGLWVFGNNVFALISKAMFLNWEQFCPLEDM